MVPGLQAAIAIVLPAVVGAAAGRGWALLLPFVTVPTYFLGVLAGWWGAGVGDGWEFGFAACLTLAFAGGCLGIWAHVAARRL